MKFVYYPILLIALLFPYYKMATWKYALATLVTITIFKKLHPQNFKELLGLSFEKKLFRPAIIIFMVSALLMEILIQIIIKPTGVTKDSTVLLSFWILRPFFQSLNEEMFGRAYLIHLLEKITPKKSTQSYLMAVIFTLLHFLFCIIIFDVNLSPIAGFTFFFATIAMNLIYYRTGNILYTWAIHFGINFTFFGGIYLDANELLLNDAQKLNLIYGHFLIPIVAFITLIFYYKFSKAKKI